MRRLFKNAHSTEIFVATCLVAALGGAAPSSAVSVSTEAASATQDDRKEGALGALPIGEQQQEGLAIKSPRSFSPPASRHTIGTRSGPEGGRPENQWRYRFYDGRWWYWTANNQWSYYNGRRWTPWQIGEYQSRKVDPALLRLEAREGTAGPRRWPNRGGAGGAAGAAGGGWGISGTQGSLGGAPSGSFTNPAGVPSAVNTSTGTTTGVSGLTGQAPTASGAPAGGIGGAGTGR